MNLFIRFQTRLMLRRADHIIRNAKRRADMRAHLNRPHVQSDHLISWPVPRTEPEPVPEPGITPLYMVFAAFVVGVILYINIFHAEAAPVFACAQIVSK